MDFNGFGIGKLLVICGAILLLTGLLVMLLGKISGFPKLPGDILIKRDGFTFYFPIVTSIILSIILTVIFAVFRKLK